MTLDTLLASRAQRAWLANALGVALVALGAADGRTAATRLRDTLEAVLGALADAQATLDAVPAWLARPGEALVRDLDRAGQPLRSGTRAWLADPASHAQRLAWADALGWVVGHPATAERLEARTAQAAGRFTLDRLADPAARRRVAQGLALAALLARPADAARDGGPLTAALEALVEHLARQAAPPEALPALLALPGDDLLAQLDFWGTPLAPAARAWLADPATEGARRRWARALDRLLLHAGPGRRSGAGRRPDDPGPTP